MNELVVNIWQERKVIPTYETGAPEKNPMFFEKRVYQGSSGVVYPNPVIEKIFDKKKDVEYTALFLENKYLKIMVLPELGGRIQMAYDKIKQRHFIYYNQVIKPALVGLCGPWISGGIEFNWPQHHRPSTYQALDYSLKENADGSKTIWVNEVERMFGTKGMAGFTLYPDKAYIEVSAKIYNRTALPQTFLWWANPAVSVNEHYQSVFPPDVHAVFDHGKRDVSSFPIATGTYYKVDYSPGTDISNYKNIPVPTSYMAVKSKYDFVGGYENDSQAGLLHVANHHISPGKKQWTWGNGDFGKAWDKNLTDSDGPYIELMTGVFTDNQPDFTWLMPYEEKTFSQYFMPYQELGLVKNASKDIMISVDMQVGHAFVKIYSTSQQLSNQLEIWCEDELVNHIEFDCSPEQIFNKKIELSSKGSIESYNFLIRNAAGKEILSYKTEQNQHSEEAKPAQAALPVSEVENNEQLYLTGLHLEQYRHATYNPVDYYQEALRRDPKDARSSNALGLWYLKRGQFAKSEIHFRNAISTYTERNPNPYDGEPYYNLGLALKYQNKHQQAYEEFYKAVWNSAWQDSGYFCLAQIDLMENKFDMALEHIDWAIDRNARNNKAWVLKAAILRKDHQPQQSIQVAKEALKRDHFNLGAYLELSFAYTLIGDDQASAEALTSIRTLARDYHNSFLEYALDYAAAGLFSDAIYLLKLLKSADTVHPMVLYYLGWLHLKTNQNDTGLIYFQQAAKASPDLCFPNRLEEIDILTTALEIIPSDAKAPYYLGNLWYDKRQYKEAIAMWELSASRDMTFPTAYRNLGIAEFNKNKNAALALTYFEKAFELDPKDARVFMELDQLYKRLNHSPQERLARLAQHQPLVNLRDDLYLEMISLYSFLKQPEKAYELLTARKFHPWEGGEGKVPAEYIASLVELAKNDLVNLNFEQVIEKLEQAKVFPENLGEGKLIGMQENDLDFWIGCAYEQLGQQVTANESFQKASQGENEPAAVIFYNDQQPDKIYYQALALQKLGKAQQASAIFHKLISYGEEHFSDKVQVDYFAVSLPDMLIFEDNLVVRHETHCLYIMGLGYLGLKRAEQAREMFEKVLKKNAVHFGAMMHLSLMEGQLINYIHGETVITKPSKQQ